VTQSTVGAIMGDFEGSTVVVVVVVVVVVDGLIDGSREGENTGDLDGAFDGVIEGTISPQIGASESSVGAIVRSIGSPQQSSLLCCTVQHGLVPKTS